MNVFLESFKAERWKEQYFRYKPEEEKGSNAYYITVPPNDEKAFQMVEHALENAIDFDSVVGVNVQSVVDMFDKSKMNQIIRFDYDKSKVYAWNKPEGVIS
jgi:hypothetical protein